MLICNIVILLSLCNYRTVKSKVNTENFMVIDQRYKINQKPYSPKNKAKHENLLTNVIKLSFSDPKLSNTVVSNGYHHELPILYSLIINI